MSKRHKLISADDEAALLAIVRAEAFKSDPTLTMEQNALNFAEKIFLFVKTGVVPNAKTTERLQ